MPLGRGRAATEPYSGCSDITNPEAIRGRIALMQRGQCMFAEKARNVQKSGAIGGIVIDDNDGSSSDTAPLFQMAGDGKNTDDITIPMLFLFSKEGNLILHAIREYQEVEVLLSDKAKDRATIFKGKIVPNYILNSNLEGESGEQRPVENDSQKQVPEEASMPQDHCVSKQDSKDEASVISQPELDSSANSDNSPLPKEDLSSESSKTNAEDLKNSGDDLQVHSGSSDDPRNKEKWDNKVQPIESILADWQEDIEAFEIMEKDEL
ncbi:hypothetical protein FKM82_022203 [Ascaphus truei]